jgi:hypothetical protein
MLFYSYFRKIWLLKMPFIKVYLMLEQKKLLERICYSLGMDDDKLAAKDEAQ